MGKFNFNLPPVVDLFSTQEEREEAKNTKALKEIPIADIDSFPNHPFTVLDDEDMEQLVESIKERGVETPALVRKKDNGRYELISGHRRKRACEIIGLETLKCEVLELTDDEAVITMVESNLMGRSRILPSNKAFAYKMQLEAMKRKAGRPFKSNLSPLETEKNMSPVETQSRSDAILSEHVGESRAQIQRYIRLTELIPELLQMVDDEKFSFRPAVEISYLKKDEQKILLDFIEKGSNVPSLAQAESLKKLSQWKSLTENLVSDVLKEKKPKQSAAEKRRNYFRTERLKSVIPDGADYEETEDFLYKAAVYYRENVLNMKKEL